MLTSALTPVLVITKNRRKAQPLSQIEIFRSEKFNQTDSY